MRSSITSIALAAIIGLVIGLLLQSPTTNEAPRDSISQPPVERSAKSPLHTDTNDQLAILQEQLSGEILAREKLQASVVTLEKKLAVLETQNGTAENKSITTPPKKPTSAAVGNRAWFKEQALIDAGVDAETAQNIKSRFENQELEKLYLRDKATREGWFGSRRYREEVDKLDAQLSGMQEELGDEAYAAYLFATGQSNRVVVQSVLAKSSADTAGLHTDDQILSYGDQRIYNWRDLRTATTQGDVNETVAVEIVRNGKKMTIYVQRGPLGIRMSSVSLPP